MNEAPPLPRRNSSHNASYAAAAPPASATSAPNTVAGRLGISLPRQKRIPRFGAPSHPPVSPRRPKSTALPVAEIDRRLDPLYKDALAGVADRLLAKKARVKVRDVRRWRARRQIRGRKGRTPRAVLAGLYFRELLHPGERSAVEHHVAGSVARFEPPPYVLRIPLDYGGLVDVVRRLRASGLSLTQISDAIGIAVEDLAIAARYAAEARQR